MVKEMVRDRVRDRVRVRAGARECNTSFFFFSLLQNVVNIFVFIGSVASYEYFNKMTYTVSNRVNLVRPMTIATCWLLNEVGVNIQLTL